MSNADELEAKARQLATQGDVMKAIEVARQAIMADPGRMSLLDDIAATYAKRETKPLGTVAAQAEKQKTTIEAAQGVDIPLLSALSPHAFVAMARRMPECSFAAGEIIIFDGQPGEHLYIVIEGRAAVHRGDQQLAVLSDGEFFGELALLTAQPRVASVTAIEPTRCFTIDKALLDDLSEIYPKVGEVARSFARTRLANSALLKSAVFSKLSQAERSALIEKFEVLNVAGDERVLTEGEAMRGLFVVLAGEMVVTVLDEEVAALGPGEIVGEISTLFSTSTTASVTARGDAILMRLAPEIVEQALSSYPELKEALSELGQERWALI